MSTNKIYIYGVVPNFYSADMFRSLEKSGIYAIGFQDVTAIVSDTDDKSIGDMDRESLGQLLVHHQKTIEDLIGKGFNMLIPMRLGTTVNSKKEVVKILEVGYDLIIETLKKIESVIEIDIAVTWADLGGVLKKISAYPDVVAMKAEVENNSKTVLQLDQVKIGMLVQAKLKEENTKTELSILDSLLSCSIDIKTHEVMNDQMITNSAFLLKMSKMEMFYQTIDELDEVHEGLLNFKIVGPLPCYSFYTLEVDELNLDFVLSAKKELDLKEMVSESVIKKAYLEKSKLFHPDSQLKNDNGEGGGFNIINKAYHTLLNYSVAASHTSEDGLFSLATEKIAENLIIVKIKE